jgi:hypothetical protein
MLRSLARIGQEEPQQAMSQYVISSLSGYIETCYSRAKDAAQPLQERLLKCERQRRGEYEPDKLAAIRMTGGSEVYLMLTDIKCRAAESWIKDVMLSAGEEPFKLEPTEIPEVPQEIMRQIEQQTQQDAQLLMQMGYDLTQDLISEQVEFVKNQTRRTVADMAERAMRNMNAKILDTLQEAQWDRMLEDVIYDFVTFPFCVIKGPVVKRRKTLKWGNNWEPVVGEELVYDFERVSPYDCFPSPAATTTQDGYFCRRHRMMIPDLQALIGVPGYNDAEIQAAIDDYKIAGLRSMQYGDTERDRLAGRNSFYQDGEIIEAVEFWGDAHGSMLVEWGLGVEPNKVYQITAWKVGTHVIMAQVNPDPLGKRPYSKACWEKIPGAFAGKALAETMSDIQELCNNSGRALANNMSVASGPQVEVTIDRLPPGTELSKMHPWKIWQTTSDRTGGGQPAIRFFQPDMNADALLQVLQYFTRIADEVTGVPNYIYGSTNVSGAGRTASGLSMLMDNASKGIKQAILSLDGATNEVLTRLYFKLMINDPDQSIKGDMKVVPSGVVGALIKDHIQEKRQLFLQTVSNPTDQGIIGIKGRVELLREMAKGLHLDIDKVLPAPDMIEQMHQSGMVPPEVQQQLQEMQGMLQQAQQQLADKQAEIDVRNREIEAKVEVARISAAANVDSRMHENEVRAATDRDARVTVAQIDSQTKKEIAAMNAESEARQQERDLIAEQRKHQMQLEAEANAQQTQQELQQLLQPVLKKIEVLEKQEPEEPKEEKEVPPPQPVIVNVSIDAKTGTVKKQIKVQHDANGNIIGATAVEEEAKEPEAGGEA